MPRRGGLRWFMRQDPQTSKKRVDFAVRPAIREATTPADGKTMEELLETAKVENAQLLDETFRMRRQMEDLR